jgi:hypothetical protein
MEPRRKFDSVMKTLSASILLAALLISSALLYVSGAFDTFVRVPEWKQKVLARLTDPESARFRDIATNSMDWTCGSVSAKNSMGGYARWTKFMVLPPSTLKNFERPDWEVTFEYDYAAVVDLCR